MTTTTQRQLGLFDAREGQRRKERVLDVMHVQSAAWQAEAKALAIRISGERGSVTADDVTAILGMPPEVHPNAVGALFKGKGWHRIGVTASKRRTSNGSVVGVWRWVQ